MSLKSNKPLKANASLKAKKPMATKPKKHTVAWYKKEARTYDILLPWTSRKGTEKNIAGRTTLGTKNIYRLGRDLGIERTRRIDWRAFMSTTKKTWTQFSRKNQYMDMATEKLAQRRLLKGTKFGGTEIAQKLLKRLVARFVSSVGLMIGGHYRLTIYMEGVLNMLEAIAAAVPTINMSGRTLKDFRYFVLTATESRFMLTVRLGEN